MAQEKRTNLGYLGYSFQIRLVRQIVEYRRASEEIMDINGAQ